MRDARCQTGLRRCNRYCCAETGWRGCWLLLNACTAYASSRQVPIRCSMFQCSRGFTRLFAAIVPDAATAGKPIPGKVQSLRIHEQHLIDCTNHLLSACYCRKHPHPTASRPLRAVFWKGKTLCPATMPGPANGLRTRVASRFIPAGTQGPAESQQPHRTSPDDAAGNGDVSTACQPGTQHHGQHTNGMERLQATAPALVLANIMSMMGVCRVLAAHLQEI